MSASGYRAIDLGEAGKVPASGAPAWLGYAVPAALLVVSVASVFFPSVDRSGWSELPCLSSHSESYRRPDDRTHAAGNRGGLVTVTRSVCDERASIGPVMPRGWNLGTVPIRYAHS